MPEGAAAIIDRFSATTSKDERAERDSSTNQVAAEPARPEPLHVRG
jgi:hypothetical protein